MNRAYRFFPALLLCAAAQTTRATDAPATPAASPATPATSANATSTPHSKYKNIFVIVHGAWGGGWAFKEVDELLTDDGNKVYRPTLTGQGEKVHLSSPDISLTTHIDDIANVIIWEDLHDVVLVGHSYGGMVITGVADKVPERIKKIIYVDAVLPVDGENFGTALSGGQPGNTTLVGRQPNAAGYFPASRASQAQPIPHDVDMPAKPIMDPISLKNQDKVKTIPTTYILTVDPGKQPSQDTFYQSYLRAQARGWDTGTMEGDHNVQWSHPKELVALLEKAAGNLTPPNPPRAPAAESPAVSTTPAAPAASTPATP